MIRKIIIILVFLLIGHFCGATATNVFFPVEEGQFRSEINETDTLPVIKIDKQILSDTLFTGGSSRYTLRLENTGEIDFVYQISGDFIVDEKYQNYALEFDGLDDYVDCGDLGFGENVRAITVEMWYRPYEISGEYGGWEFVVPDSVFMFSLGLWMNKYSAKSVSDYHYYQAHPANRWAHVVMIYDGEKQRFFTDGYTSQLLSLDSTTSTTPVSYRLNLSEKPFHPLPQGPQRPGRTFRELVDRNLIFLEQLYAVRHVHHAHECTDNWLKAVMGNIYNCPGCSDGICHGLWRKYNQGGIHAPIT